MTRTKVILNYILMIVYGDSCKIQLQSTLLITNTSLQWRHNDHDGVSNYQPHGCLLNRSFRRRSKKTSKLRVTGLCGGGGGGGGGNSPGPVNSPHKAPVTRKMVPFDDVIMIYNDTTSKATQLMLKHISGWNQESCAKSRYQGQEQVIASHRYCGM